MRTHCLARRDLCRRALAFGFLSVILLLVSTDLSSPAFAQSSESSQAEDVDPFEALNKDFLKATEDEPEAPNKTDLKKTGPKKTGPESRPTEFEPPESEKPKDPEDDSPYRLSDKAIGLQTEDVPTRPTPLLEIGNPFLGTGPITFGFETPTGSVWQPSLLVYGTFRSGFNAYRVPRASGTGHTDIVEWSNRLDIFANLQLSGFANERLVFGMRPLDRAIAGGDFTGYRFEPGDEESVNEFNRRVTAFFFEGDLGEIFPFIDDDDRRALDLGFSVGRQEISFQQGILVNDIMDAVGLTRNNLRIPWTSNVRLTGLYAWNQVHRDGGFIRDDSAHLLGFFSLIDIGPTTLEADAIYVIAPDDTGDGFYGGLAATQRFLGSFATTLRVLASVPTETETNANQRGTLLVMESSWTPTGTEDILFVNAYLGIDRFRSAARSPSTGGPLARVGILYAAIGLGGFPGALDGSPDRSGGASVGYQHFFGGTRTQLIVELGGRKDLSGGLNRGMMAAGARFQQALFKRFIVRVDAFVAKQEQLQEVGGAHVEFSIQF